MFKFNNNKQHNGNIILFKKCCRRTKNVALFNVQTLFASSSEDKRKEILKTFLHWFLIKDVYCKKIVHKYCNNSIEIIMSSLLVRALINTSWELPLDSKSLFL